MADTATDPEKSYYRAMAAEDAFGVVIRAGAYIDHELIKLLEATLAHPKALKKIQLDYDGRCALAVAVGLDPRFQAPLAALGSIRNRLAHNPEASLTVQDANNLYDALSSAERQMVQDNFAKTLKRRGQRIVRLADQKPLARFVLIAIVLRSALVAARREIEALKAPD
ncbi:hypothetical protein [Mesorhizobium abyssinicae]|uniref:hypothetical protein n=1 Tax=Mesorhizobium abyssinicae TaxID=1209958 RepID=UPI003394C6EB